MADLAARLGRLTREERILLEKRLSAKAAPGIRRRKPEDPAPLSFSQRRIWYLEQLNPGTATYNAPNAFCGRGKLDVEAFRRAVNLIVERHTVLRTRIGTSETGEPVSQLATEWDVVEVISLDGQGEQEALALVDESAKRPFDISQDLMLRVLLVFFGEEDFIVVFTTHHIAWDGVSKAVFFRELGVLYDAIATGKDPVLPEPAIQYADYALWQQRAFSGVRRDKEIHYWKGQMAGAPAYLDIPLDKPRPAVQRFKGAKIPFTLPADLLAGAQDLSRREKTTLYTTMLAAYNVFLLAFTGQEDLCVATPFAGRDEPETQSVIGFFTNTVVLRTRVGAKLTFDQVIGRVRESVLGAQDHQLMPMDELVEVLQSPRDLSRMPIAQVNFRLQGGKPPEPKLHGIKLVQLPLIDTSISKFDMALEVASAEGEAGYLEYNTDLFSEERMGRVPAAFEVLFAALLASPQLPVGKHAAFKAAGELSPKRRGIGRGIGSLKEKSVALPVQNMNELIDDLTAAILARADIDDCYLMERESDAARMLVAYIVANGAVTGDEISAALPAEVPGRRTPDAYAPVTALPLTASGDLDLEALQAVELVDDHLQAAVERGLEEAAGMGRAAFVVESTPAPEAALHLSDLFPGWKRAGEPRNETSTARVVASASTGSNDRPAMCMGEPLRIRVPRNLPAALKRAAADFGTSGITYIQDDEREIVQSYADLLEDAERILKSLRGLGAQPQDRFIFQFQRNQDFIPAFWACQLGGFVPVPISIAPTYEQPNATISKLHNAWQMLDKPWVLTNEDLRPAVAGLANLFPFEGLRISTIETLRKEERDCAWHDSEPDELALLLFTSGSTGKPKAVRQTHHALLSRSAATSQGTNLSSADVFFNWMPLDHVGGIVMYQLPGVYLGARQIHIPTPVILENPLKWLDYIERYRVTTTWAPNFAYGLVNTRADEIAKRKWDLSTLVFILNAGESIVARTARHFLELLLAHGLPPTAMRPSWGMSETCSAVTYSDRFTLQQTADSDMFVQVGAPAPEFAFRIVDSEDGVLPEGTIGRLQVRGPSVTKGYDQNPAANAESFTKDGWFITGDLGKVDDGQLSITGRQKEVIIVNGVNFYPHELEALVEEVAGVAPSFSAVCAVREEGTDTDSIAVFFHPVTDHEGELGGIIREIRGRMVRNAGVNPSYMVPLEKRQIPKTEIGKIQRTQLQQRLASGDFDEVLKCVDILTESVNTIPNWFFEKVWQPRRLGRKVLEKTADCWVIFCDKAGLGEALCAKLEPVRRVVTVEMGKVFSSVGRHRFVIDPANPDHYRQLFAALGEGTAITRVLHLWTHRQATKAVSASGAVMLLFLLRELTTVAGTNGIDLDVISSDAQFVAAEDTQSFTHGALPAMLRAMTAEDPRLRCRHIDLDTAGSNAEQLIEELTAATFDPEVAYREGTRYVPRLKRFAKDATQKAANEFVDGGVYLLTGGLGGIGVEIARLLLTRHGARLLLIGRKAMDDDASPAAAALASLQTLGEVRYEIVDVCDIGALEQSVAAAERRWGQPLDGVLHMAAVYHDGVLVRETAETLEDAFHAKVMGAVALAKVLETRKQALFVGFSSVLAFFPGALVGAYAGANRALENLTLGLRARGFRAYSVAWSSWRETGMSRGQSAREALRAKGIREISIEQGWNSLLVGLRYGKPLSFAGLDAANAAIRRVTVGEPCGIQRLSAFYVSADEEVQRQLREMKVADRFGNLVRFSTTPMQQIPLTASGLVDREALLAFVRRGGAAPYVEPKTETERQICAVWQDVLSAPHLGAEDNFFMFGGHSLLATRVMSRLCSIFSVDIPLRSLFDSPTVRGLAGKIEALRGGRGKQYVTIKRVVDRSRLPLSFTQQRLWFLEQWQPGTAVYNVPLVFRARGVLDTEALQRALDAVVARHESLRTTFHMSGTEPIQRAHEQASAPLRVVDIRERDGDPELHAMQMIAEDTCRTFDLSSDSMMRALVVRVADEEYLLGLALHHIAADGWSLDILFRELSAFYEAFVIGRELELEALPIQFGDYAAWQREYLNGAVLDEQLSYWREQLQGAAPQLKLPTDMPRPATQSFRGAVHAFAFPRDLVTTVSELCRSEEVTPFIALLTVLQVLMRQYSGQNDISIGSPISNRTNLETEGLIGFFANTLVLRTVFPADPTFREMLAISRETALGAYAHEHMPFERLVEILKPARAGYNPLFQVNFRVLTSPPATLRFGALEAERTAFDPGIARFDLALELLITPERLEGFFEYSTDLFHAETIRRLQSHFEQTLRLVAKRPEAPLSSLGLDQMVSDRGSRVIRRRAAKIPGAS